MQTCKESLVLFNVKTFVLKKPKIQHSSLFGTIRENSPIKQAI